MGNKKASCLRWGARVALSEKAGIPVKTFASSLLTWMWIGGCGCWTLLLQPITKHKHKHKSDLFLAHALRLCVRPLLLCFAFGLANIRLGTVSTLPFFGTTTTTTEARRRRRGKQARKGKECKMRKTKRGDSLVLVPVAGAPVNNQRQRPTPPPLGSSQIL